MRTDGVGHLDDWRGAVSGREKSAWKQMHTLLTEIYGAAAGGAYFACAQEQARIWLQATRETSPTRLKTMRETILPRVAVYAVLKDNGEDADAVLEKYVREVAGPMMHRIYAGAERVPFFYDLFSRGMQRVTDRSDRWDCESKREKDRLLLDIHKCLWYDACVECGCPEACRFFCECDNYTYGNLHTLRFWRTQTLGTGGKLCDFVFYRK